MLVGSTLNPGSLDLGSFDALAFSVFDRNGDGSLNSKEYGSLVGALGDSGGLDIGNVGFSFKGPDPENFTFSSVDKNKDGKIGLDEFGARTRDVRYTLGSQVFSEDRSGSLPTVQAMTRLIFEVYDKNDDGKLSAAEEAVFEGDFGVDLPPESGTGGLFALPKPKPAADRTVASFDTALEWAAKDMALSHSFFLLKSLSDYGLRELNTTDIVGGLSSVMPQLWARMSDLDNDSKLNFEEMDCFQRNVGNHVRLWEPFLWFDQLRWDAPSISGMARQVRQPSGD
jgi:Ca2+-binding EF-hand superfamily protein